ncbi:MAG: hypothetical protein CFE33_07170 [Pseudorhodobacter sp. PARRP1]|nr:MAG: hypothetical protein CFE33_07170 [Pseudorhodobacter sp. PARRP1]
MRFFLTTTRMLRIPTSICFEGETMAAGQGRQQQIDTESVAWGWFFELKLRNRRIISNFSNFLLRCGGAKADSIPARASDALSRRQKAYALQSRRLPYIVEIAI